MTKIAHPLSGLPRKRRVGLIGIFLTAIAMIAAHAQGTPHVTEFATSNDEVLVLPDGSSPDWIEIHNPDSAAIDLAGWHLTDDSSDFNKWTFPSGSVIPAGGYLLVYASGEDLSDPASDLHTNFGLNQNGEFLALVNPQNEVTAPGFGSIFPEQFTDVSFGFPAGQTEAAYFTTPTPGQANNDSIQGFVKDTKFSHIRGFFETSFQLEVTSATPGASIFYTLDGSDPSPASSSVDAASPTSIPVLSLQISSTTIVRAYASKSGFEPTNTDTQTYLFLDEVIANPVMATSITQNSVWGPQMRDALLEIPTISLVTQEAIPTEPIMSPPEIPVSIEMIFPDGKEGFQLDAGVERFGGPFTLYDKHALRISFKRIYGEPKLRFDLFGDTPYGGDTAVDTFDQILLRNGSQDALFATNYPHSRGVYYRNRYFFDRQLEGGDLSLRGKFVHVYLNGTYYGQHHLMERPNADFMATHLGGEEEDYDIMKGRSGVFVSQGEGAAWDFLTSNTNDWEIVQNYMDVESYINYMLLNFYGGNEHDWFPIHNWVAGRKREDGSKFNFFMWDNDFLIRRGGNATTGSTANTTDNGGPGNMWNALIAHEEFRIMVADRAQELFYNDGMFTKERVQTDITKLSESLSRTIIPESARWGTKAELTYTPDSFQQFTNWIVDINTASRTDVVLSQMQSAGIFTDIPAPTFQQFGGEIPADFDLLVTFNNGGLYYTTDGSDPRLIGGEINPTAQFLPENVVAIPAGSDWNYFDRDTDYGTAWQSPDFDDSGWLSGAAPLGFGGITNTAIATQVNPLPRELTIYYRKTIQIDDAASIQSASLGLHADGGAIVYVNGVEVVRDNMPTGVINKDSPALNDGNEGVFDPFTFDGSLLTQGENVISVEVHNRTLGSSDMVFDLELSYNQAAQIPLSGTTQIKARSFDGVEWSALTESVFIGDEPASSVNLVISEIHYNPSAEQGSGSEYIELMNISEQAINLSGVSFTQGISYTFPDQAALAAGERLVLVSDPAIFAAAYGNDITIGGVYSSQLSNGGERITLSDADGLVIQTLEYNDTNPWPEVADGFGYSLTLVSPVGNPDPALAQNWRTSLEPGGSPSSQDSTPYTGNTDAELLAYATGGQTLPTISLSNGLPIFEFQRQHGADSVRLVVEVSTDFGNWSETGVVFQSQTNTGDNRSAMRYILNLPDSAKAFARIRAILLE